MLLIEKIPTIPNSLWLFEDSVTQPKDYKAAQWFYTIYLSPEDTQLPSTAMLQKLKKKLGK